MKKDAVKIALIIVAGVVAFVVLVGLHPALLILHQNGTLGDNFHIGVCNRTNRAITFTMIAKSDFLSKPIQSNSVQAGWEYLHCAHVSKKKHAEYGFPEHSPFPIEADTAALVQSLDQAFVEMNVYIAGESTPFRTKADLLKPELITYENENIIILVE